MHYKAKKTIDVEHSKVIECKWVHVRLRQFSVLKPEGCKHRPITLDMNKLSIQRPIRRRQPSDPLPRHIKHQTQQQQTADWIGVKEN